MSNFFWLTVRIERGFIALAIFCACTSPTLKVIGVMKCSRRNIPVAFIYSLYRQDGKVETECAPQE